MWASRRFTRNLTSTKDATVGHCRPVDDYRMVSKKTSSGLRMRDLLKLSVEVR